LGRALGERGVSVFARERGITTSHQFAIEAASYGGGQAAAKKLRQANILTCGIGLPIAPVEGDVNGLRIGTPEIVRWGMGPGDMPELAGYIAEALSGTRALHAIADDVTKFRRRFSKLHFVR
jgi:glycine hydroxymethyltransferase